MPKTDIYPLPSAPISTGAAVTTWPKKLQHLCRRATLVTGLFLGVLGGIGAAHAQTAQPAYPAVMSSEGKGLQVRIQVLGDSVSTLSPIGDDQSRIMLYRAAQDALSGATSVFVDGRYHASLVPGAWSALCYRTGAAEIGARQMQVGSQPKDRMDSTTVVQLRGGQTHYLRVQEEQGRPIMKPVPLDQAHQEMGQFKEQVHTVSRVAQACREVVAPPPPAPTPAAPPPAVVAPPVPTPTVQTAPFEMVPAPKQPELLRITLPADALFAFGRSDATGMTGSGMAAMDNMQAMLKTDFSQVDSMHVVGHADPLGNAQFNEQLSSARARTVARHLQKQAPQGVRVSAEGRGAREPVIESCGRLINARSIACNQPNRRVVVEVLGTRR